MADTVGSVKSLAMRSVTAILVAALALYLAFAVVASIYIFTIMVASPILVLLGIAGTIETIVAEIELIAFLFVLYLGVLYSFA
ncbi:MAG TPA: hypothetical protein VG964_01885 [Candidatus Saccharimonadales bacterium]|nr:hypothetical protein [Candidatus Saccharimonadales bacterium]